MRFCRLAVSVFVIVVLRVPSVWAQAVPCRLQASAAHYSDFSPILFLDNLGETDWVDVRLTIRGEWEGPEQPHEELPVDLTFPLGPDAHGFFSANTATCPGALCSFVDVFNDLTLNAGGGASITDVGVVLFEAAPVPVPEPATLALTALGLAGVVNEYRRRRGSR